MTLSTSRREALVFLATGPCALLVGCGSDGGSDPAPTNSGNEASQEEELRNPFEVVEQTEDTAEIPEVEGRPLIPVDSPQARALQWEQRSTRDGQNCAGCLLYGAAPDATSGTCTLFPANSTLAVSWCTAYVPRT